MCINSNTALLTPHLGLWPFSPSISGVSDFFTINSTTVCSVITEVMKPKIQPKPYRWWTWKKTSTGWNLSWLHLLWKPFGRSIWSVSIVLGKKYEWWLQFGYTLSPLWLHYKPWFLNILSYPFGGRKWSRLLETSSKRAKNDLLEKDICLFEEICLRAKHLCLTASSSLSEVEIYQL